MTFDIQTFGVGELWRVTIGSTNAKMDIGVFWHFDPADDCITRDEAVIQLIRTFVA
jgi:hypothetical protein